MNVMSLKQFIILKLVQLCLFQYTTSSLLEDHLEECHSSAHEEKFQQELKDVRKSQKISFERHKRSISANYKDAHCLENFETKDNAIIKTKESQANGAQYLNETTVETFEFCLRVCCETPLCNVAVYDLQVIGTFEEIDILKNKWMYY